MEARDLAGAMALVDARLAAAPEDLDARAWRARLLAWTGHRAEAEAEFRGVLARAPRDADILLGLAALLGQENRNGEALGLLDRAAQIPPPRADVLAERGRVLRAMGRRKEARQAFLEARKLEPENLPPARDEALAGLRSLEGPPRYELVAGNETDTFNFTGAANTQTISWVARASPRLTFSAEGDFYQRFGFDAGKFLSAAAWRFTRANSFTLGGGAGEANTIIPHAELFFELGHGFALERSGPLRGLEASYRQHWLWFEQAHVLVLTGSVAADFSRDVRLAIAGNAARSGFSGTPVAWEPSGSARLDFPVPRVPPRLLLLNLQFAVGSENFGQLDQIEAFASRTYGGGFRWGLGSRQFANFYLARQYRSGGRNEALYGAGYGVRF